MIDRKAKIVNAAQINDLGNWMKRKTNHGIQKKGSEAESELKKCAIPEDYLLDAMGGPTRHADVHPLL